MTQVAWRVVRQHPAAVKPIAERRRRSTPEANVTEEPNETDRQKCDPSKTDHPDRAVSCRLPGNGTIDNWSVRGILPKQMQEWELLMKLSKMEWIIKGAQWKGEQRNSCASTKSSTEFERA